LPFIIPLGLTETIVGALDSQSPPMAPVDTRAEESVAQIEFSPKILPASAGVFTVSSRVAASVPQPLAMV
jgi:hypothetical protein